MSKAKAEKKEAGSLEASEPKKKAFPEKVRHGLESGGKGDRGNTNEATLGNKAGNKKSG